MKRSNLDIHYHPKHKLWLIIIGKMKLPSVTAKKLIYFMIQQIVFLMQIMKIQQMYGNMNKVQQMIYMIMLRMINIISICIQLSCKILMMMQKNMKIQLNIILIMVISKWLKCMKRLLVQNKIIINQCINLILLIGKEYQQQIKLFMMHNKQQLMQQTKQQMILQIYGFIMRIYG